MGNGPVTKIFWSIMLGMVTVKFYSWYRPFVADSDDTLAETINWVCLLVFVGTLASYMEALDGALGLFLILTNVACFVIITILVYSDINRERAALTFAYTQAKLHAKRLSKSASFLSPRSGKTQCAPSEAKGVDDLVGDEPVVDLADEPDDDAYAREHVDAAAALRVEASPSMPFAPPPPAHYAPPPPSHYAPLLPGHYAPPPPGHYAPLLLDFNYWLTYFNKDENFDLVQPIEAASLTGPARAAYNAMKEERRADAKNLKRRRL